MLIGLGCYHAHLYQKSVTLPDMLPHFYDNDKAMRDDSIKSNELNNEFKQLLLKICLESELVKSKVREAARVRANVKRVEDPRGLRLDLHVKEGYHHRTRSLKAFSKRLTYSKAFMGSPDLFQEDYNTPASPLNSRAQALATFVPSTVVRARNSTTERASGSGAAEQFIPERVSGLIISTASMPLVASMEGLNRERRSDPHSRPSKDSLLSSRYSHTPTIDSPTHLHHKQDQRERQQHKEPPQHQAQHQPLRLHRQHSPVEEGPGCESSQWQAALQEERGLRLAAQAQVVSEARKTHALSQQLQSLRRRLDTAASEGRKQAQEKETLLGRLAALRNLNCQFEATVERLKRQVAAQDKEKKHVEHMEAAQHRSVVVSMQQYVREKVDAAERATAREREKVGRLMRQVEEGKMEANKLRRMMAVMGFGGRSEGGPERKGDARAEEMAPGMEGREGTERATSDRKTMEKGDTSKEERRSEDKKEAEETRKEGEVPSNDQGSPPPEPQKMPEPTPPHYCHIWMNNVECKGEGLTGYAIE
jgi:hypothetical protein